jgi:hypothetical protein
MYLDREINNKKVQNLNEFITKPVIIIVNESDACLLASVYQAFLGLNFILLMLNGSVTS